MSLQPSLGQSTYLYEPPLVLVEDFDPAARQLGQSTYLYEPSLVLAEDADSAARQLAGEAVSIVSTPTQISVSTASYRFELTGIYLELDGLTMTDGIVSNVRLFKGDVPLYSADLYEWFPKENGRLEMWPGFPIREPVAVAHLLRPLDPAITWRIVGSQFDDIATSFTAIDWWTYFVGNAGNDSFVVTQGLSHDVNGGRGFDTVVYPHAFGDYEVKTSGIFTHVRYLRSGTYNSDRLVDVDALKFTDVTISPYDLMFVGSSVPPISRQGSDVERYTNANTGAYFYTSDISERNALKTEASPWKSDGVVFGSHAIHLTGDAVVFRFANEANGGYFLTSSPAERDWVLANRSDFRLESDLIYEPGTSSADTTPVFRLANLTSGSYLYTVSASERDFVKSLGTWRDEGVGFYAPNAAATKSLDGVGTALTADAPFSSEPSDGANDITNAGSFGDALIAGAAPAIGSMAASTTTPGDLFF